MTVACGPGKSSPIGFGSRPLQGREGWARRALDLHSGERIALKVMLQHASDRARFLHERSRGSNKLLLARGDLDGGEREARVACDLLTDVPTVRPLALATLADVLRARGDFVAALRVAEDADAMARQGVESGAHRCPPRHARGTHSSPHAAGELLDADPRERPRTRARPCVVALISASRRWW
jgi:hypothetical protein